jgi:hypothetical protein
MFSIGYLRWKLCKECCVVLYVLNMNLSLHEGQINLVLGGHGSTM